MMSCDRYELEPWSPELIGSGGRVTWTRVRCRGFELSNSLEAIHSTHNPVQVRICATCGAVGCASDGYVDISRLGDLVLWTAPREEGWPVGDVDIGNAVVIPVPIWEAWQIEVPSLPSADTFAPTTLGNLASAWLAHARSKYRSPHMPSLRQIPLLLKEYLLAGDTLDREEAVRVVSGMAAWFLDAGDEVATGTLRRADEVGAEVETLYFDGPAEGDWTAVAVLADCHIPAFGKEWVYVP